MDYCGISFESEYMLFVDEMEELPGVYVIHTEKTVIDVGESDNLKTAIESHMNTQVWIEKAGKGDIYIAFHLDKDKESRKDLEKFLRSKIDSLT